MEGEREMSRAAQFPRRGWVSQCRRRKARAGDHGLDGPNAGDRLFREWKSERYCSQEFAVDINRTAAHALEHPGFGERTAAEAREDDRLLWRDIFKDTEDFDLELFDAVALEDGAPDAAEAWVDFFEGEEVLGCRRGADREAESCGECAAEASYALAGPRPLEYEPRSRPARTGSGIWRRKNQCD